MIVRTNVNFMGYGGFRGFGAVPQIGSVIALPPGMVDILNSTLASAGIKYVPTGAPLQYKAVSTASSSVSLTSSRTSVGQNLVTSGGHLSTGTKIALGAGAVVVIGGAIYMAKRKGKTVSVAGFADFMSLKPRKRHRRSRR